MNLRITLLAFLCLCATAILRAERVDMLKAGASKWESSQYKADKFND